MNSCPPEYERGILSTQRRPVEKFVNNFGRPQDYSNPDPTACAYTSNFSVHRLFLMQNYKLRKRLYRNKA
jgi:hypothetical protein